MADSKVSISTVEPSEVLANKHNDIIDVSTHMLVTVPDNTTRTFTLHSSSDLKLHVSRNPSPILIESNTFCMIETAKNIAIVPAGPYSSAFSKGWNKLPIELKIDILTYCVTTKTCIEQWGIRLPLVGSRSTWDTDMLHTHLIMTPEIAALSREIFYQKNVFLLEPMERFNPSQPRTLSLPPPAACFLIRKIHFRFQPRIEEWRMVESIPTKFPNLRYIHLTMECRSLTFVVQALFLNPIMLPGDFERELIKEINQIKRVVAPGLRLRCNGRLEIEGMGLMADERPDFQRYLEDRIKEKILFSCS